MPNEQLAALGRLRTLVSDLNLFLSLAGSGSENPAVNFTEPVPTRSWHPSLCASRRGPTTRSQAWRTKQCQRARPEPPMPQSRPPTIRRTRSKPPVSKLDSVLQPPHLSERRTVPKHVTPPDSVSELSSAGNQTPDPLPEHSRDYAEFNPADCAELQSDEHGADLAPLDEGRQTDSDRLSVIESDNESQYDPPDRPAAPPGSNEHQHHPSARSLEGSVCHRSPAVSRSPTQSPRSTHCPVQATHQALPDQSQACFRRSAPAHWGIAQPTHHSSPARPPARNFSPGGFPTRHLLWDRHPVYSVRRGSPACPTPHCQTPPCQRGRSPDRRLTLSPTHCPTQHSPWSPVQYSFNRQSYSQSPYDSVRSGGSGESTGQVSCRDEVGDSYDTNNAYCDEGGGFVYDDGGGGSYDDYGGDGYNDGYEDYEDY